MAMTLRWKTRELEAEYTKLLPTLEPLYQALPEEEQQKWQDDETTFFAGNPEALVARVRGLVPGAFAFDLREPWAAHRVDLKWSLWLKHADAWEERQGAEAVADMRVAFESGGASVVTTAPRKEIRFGQVVVERGRAHADFVAVWDSPADLAPDDASDEDVQCVAEWFEEYHDGDPESPVGAHVEEDVEAATFDELMVKIDACEDRLLEEEKERSKSFDEFLAEFHQPQNP